MEAQSGIILAVTPARAGISDAVGRGRLADELRATGPAIHHAGCHWQHSRRRRSVSTTMTAGVASRGSLRQVQPTSIHSELKRGEAPLHIFFPSPLGKGSGDGAYNHEGPLLGGRRIKADTPCTPSQRGLLVEGAEPLRTPQKGRREWANQARKRSVFETRPKEGT